MRVAIMPLPLFNMTVMSGAIDVLRYAADNSDRSRQAYCQWNVVSLGHECVASNSGVTIIPKQIPSFLGYDIVIVVGGALCAWPELEPELTPALREAWQKGAIVAGYCTGSFALAEAGLLADQPAAVHWRHHNDMKRLYPEVKISYGHLYRLDNHIMTCAGGTASIDATIELVRIFLGERRAMKVLPDLFIDKHRPQTMTMTEFDHLFLCGEYAIKQSIHLMEAHLARPLSIRVIAERIGVSPRTLERRYQEIAGTSPAGIYKKIRLYCARKRLLDTDDSVLQISMDTGFADASHFSRSFQQEYNILPSEYRRRYKNTDAIPGAFSVFTRAFSK